MTRLTQHLVGLEVSLRRFESRIIRVIQVGENDDPSGITEPSGQ